VPASELPACSTTSELTGWCIDWKWKFLSTPTTVYHALRAESLKWIIRSRVPTGRARLNSRTAASLSRMNNGRKKPPKTPRPSLIDRPSVSTVHSSMAMPRLLITARPSSERNW
jgi:hypothetical protein